MKARHEFQTDKEYNEYLRTYIATMVLQGLMFNSTHESGMHPGRIAKIALRETDALIKALNE